MDNLKQNAILVRDALQKINGYAWHDDMCASMKAIVPCACGYSSASQAAIEQLEAIAALQPATANKTEGE